MGRACALISLFVASTATADPSGQLAGHVTDEDTGEPVEGVIVIVSSRLDSTFRSAFTDASGAWSIPVEDTIPYAVEYEYSGTKLVHPGVRVGAHATTHLAQQIGRAHYTPGSCEVILPIPSTLPVEVGASSWREIKAALALGQRPAPAAVRIEELVNDFTYTLTPPRDPHGMAITTEVGPTPWNDATKLVRVVLHTHPVSDYAYPPRNLTVVLATWNDTVLQALRRLTDNLRAEDTLSIVRGDGIAMDKVRGDQHRILRLHLDWIASTIEQRGLTADGLRRAYELVEENLLGGNNRVILVAARDDISVPSLDAELARIADDRLDAGIALSVIALGTRADIGTELDALGPVDYAPTLDDLRLALTRAAGAWNALAPIAHDVTLDIEENPDRVESYRLLGYETVENAGTGRPSPGTTINFGHAVTALYEVTPARHATSASSETLFIVKARFKTLDRQPRVLRHTVTDRDVFLDDTTLDFAFVAAVAGFGMLLRDTPERADLDWDTVAYLAKRGIGSDEHGLRRPLLQLIQRARWLAP